MKIFLDLDSVGNIAGAYKLNAESIMRLTGQNMGNMVFRYALYSLIEDMNDYDVMDYDRLYKVLNDSKQSIDKVIISSANWLGASDEYERINEFRVNHYENIEAPFAVFGLGVQAGKQSSSLNLGPNTVKLAKILSEKSALLSVRDEFTQDVLSKLGILNTVITGCPSNFLNLDKNLGSKVAAKSSALSSNCKSWQKLRLHLSEYSGGCEGAGDVLSRTMVLLRVSPAFYVLQTPSLLSFVLRETEIIPGDYLSSAPEIYDQNILREILNSKAMCFTSVDEWLGFSRSCDFSVGMRIHGNVVPLQAEVPAVVIGHDSRTEGLSETMGLPLISPADFVEASRKSPMPLLDLATEKYSDYDNVRHMLAKRLHEFILVCGLKPSANLELFLRL